MDQIKIMRRAYELMDRAIKRLKAVPKEKGGLVPVRNEAYVNTISNELPQRMEVRDEKYAQELKEAIEKMIDGSVFGRYVTVRVWADHSDRTLVIKLSVDPYMETGYSVEMSYSEEMLRRDILEKKRLGYDLRRMLSDLATYDLVGRSR